MIIIKHKKEHLTPFLNEDSEEGKIRLSKDIPWIRADGKEVDINRLETMLNAVVQDLAANFPSIETVVKHKDLILTDDPAIETMATDGISIMMNPAWCDVILEKFDAIALEYCIIHECLHILFDHCGKHMNNLDKYSDAYKVNIAQDFEINYVIENFLREGLGNKPFKGLAEKMKAMYNEEYGKKGMMWEDIYSTLPSIERKVNRAKTSDEWKKGFTDAYNDFLKETKKSKVIESYEI